MSRREKQSDFMAETDDDRLWRCFSITWASPAVCLISKDFLEADVYCGCKVTKAETVPLVSRWYWKLQIVAMFLRWKNAVLKPFSSDALLQVGATRKRLWHLCLSSASCEAWEARCLVMPHRNPWIFNLTISTFWRAGKVPESFMVFVFVYKLDPHCCISKDAIKTDRMWWNPVHKHKQITCFVFVCLTF